MPTTKKITLKQLGPEIRRQGRAMDEALIKAFVRTARFGVTMVVRTAQNTKPRPRASGTYIRSWTVQKLKDGAAIVNTSGHGSFVERGRRRGRRPPLEPIMEWVKLKRLAKNKAKIRAIAFVIQRKIGREGTKGRWVLKRTLPAIAKRSRIEVNKALRQASKG